LPLFKDGSLKFERGYVRKKEKEKRWKREKRIRKDREEKEKRWSRRDGEGESMRTNVKWWERNEINGHNF
jgi:hypothetical protein